MQKPVPYTAPGLPAAVSQEKYSVMRPSNEIARRFRDLSITAKFGLGTGLLFALIVTVAATGYLSNRIVQSAGKSIRIAGEIQLLVTEMDRGMEKARRLHGDFFLQYPLIGLAGAHEQYAQPSIRQTARVVETSTTLRDLIGRSKVGEGLVNSRVDLNLYLSLAKRFADTSIESVELVTRLATPKTGLKAQLEQDFTALEAELGQTGKAAGLYFRMKSFAQDYMISRKRFMMQSSFNVAFSIREEVALDSAFDDDKKQKINALIDRCTAVAEQIMDIDVAINSRLNDFALQSDAAGAVSATLIDLAKHEMALARSRMELAHEIALVIISTITLFGLLVAAGVAVILNKHITRRVVRLTEVAGEHRKGNLDVMACETGEDELSRLAGTFNVMTARIKDLIGNLEEKVEQRTVELAQSEKRFRGLFEHSISGVGVHKAVEDGKDFIFADINKSGEQLLRMGRLTILGKKLTEVLPGITEFGLLDIFREVWRTGRAIRHPVGFYSDGKLEGWF